MTNAQVIQSQDSTNNGCMYITFELSHKIWKLMFSNSVKRRQISIPARDLQRLEVEIIKARHHFKLDDQVLIHSCYEAGRDGFWIHRYLQEKELTALWSTHQA